MCEATEMMREAAGTMLQDELVSGTEAQTWEAGSGSMEALTTRERDFDSSEAPTVLHLTAR
jgi:hypothetical protein